jgi:hypothetical protein
MEAAHYLYLGMEPRLLIAEEWARDST